jgi:centromere protein V
MQMSFTPMSSSKHELRWRAGGCHCGAVRYEVLCAEEVEAMSCNCSICAMTGYLHLIVDKPHFRLLKGEENLTPYTFNTRTAKHLFCKTCGVKSFYFPRSHPDGVSVNYRCLDGVPISAAHVTPFDGQNWEESARGLSAHSSQDGI